MDYYRWKAVVDGLIDTSQTDPNWLGSQFAASTSPVVVAQQIRNGQALRLPTPPPAQILTPNQFAFRCQACGCPEFVFDILPPTPAPSNAPGIILALLVSAPLFCIPVAGAIMFFGFWLLAAVVMATNKPKPAQNIRRCRACGWSQA